MFFATLNCIKLLYYLYKLFYNESDINIENVKYLSYNCGVVGQKLLQFLMMHEGFLSIECKKKFKDIFENCENHSWEHTCKIYLEDFKKPIEDDYEINEESKVPIGSGSIGQVYKLYHKKLEHYIALKIKHPNVEIEVLKYVSIIDRLIYIVEFFMKVPFSSLVREFLNNIHIQLDYITEAKNTLIMRNNFIEEEHIIIPLIHEYTPNCIIMDHYDGISFTELEDTYLQKIVSTEIYLFLISSLLNHDFLHCDLHYGNWKIQTDTNKLIIYDCGIIGQTHQFDINNKIIKSILCYDYTDIADVLLIDKDRYYYGMVSFLKSLTSNSKLSSSECLSIFLKQVITCHVRVNKEVFRCLQGLVTCISIVSVNSDKLGTILGKHTTCKDSRMNIAFYYYLIKRLNKYKKLERLFYDWLQEDLEIEEIFKDWLEESFGHRDIDIFIDVIIDKSYNKK